MFPTDCSLQHREPSTSAYDLPASVNTLMQTNSVCTRLSSSVWTCHSRIIAADRRFAVLSLSAGSSLDTAGHLSVVYPGTLGTNASKYTLSGQPLTKLTDRSINSLTIFCAAQRKYSCYSSVRNALPAR
jgi:hypothetical protein